MSVQVGGKWSVSKPVYDGVPQGSILGVLLFNVTTDDLEDVGASGQTSDGEQDDAEDEHGSPNPEPWEDRVGRRMREGSPTMEGETFVFLPQAQNVERYGDVWHFKNRFLLSRSAGTTYVCEMGAEGQAVS